MQQRKLGQSDITVAPLAFGGNVFGWSIDEKTSFSILDKFVEAGLNLIDTADVYSRWAPGNQGGESETIIGKWLAQGGRRDKVVIATKVGKDMGEGRVGLKKDYILRAVEDSLRRLQTDHIDLYQSHDDDRSTPLEETLAAYDTLVKAGKVRLIGASNYEVDRLAQARDIGRQLGLPLYQTLQPEYSLVAREGFERTLEPYCLEQGVGVIGFYSLASGFLSGKYRSEADLGKSAARGGKVKSYLNPRGFQILAALDAVAARHASTSAAVALAWLIARPSVTAPIASATSLAQLDELVAATRLQLSREDIAALDQASAY
ncbi:aldo/keto reductase [Herbaspirillum frisingense]|uniref:Aryl-alcohol dehydrogenase-like predicted oxidoreductase n=1 Tax=Herbaspirillum frisingense TaxID=92645 RepID=A0ABU1PCR1_9BURK|nr:aldo/keto reductase [Herbaspirillum frisingense]MDR6583718.1 aryl-alcohol dehydrogenase-like predicted oxidoreductase [Herbaspirillum frisingense]